MPKVTKYPRLRVYVRKRKCGKVRAYYYYDMRPEGEKDIPLGCDHAEAISRWNELFTGAPPARGRIQEAVNRWRELELPKYQNDETRKSYTKQLTRIEGVFSAMVWEDVTLPIMREYLDRRSAKIQGNREMSLFSIIWSKALLWGMTRLPWPATGIRNWKNQESARRFQVTDTLFAAVYVEAEQMLRDCMDIATATGMRLTDVRTVALPTGDLLRMKASKTGKEADFDLSMSAVLPDLVSRRRNIDATHSMLLSTADGFPVTKSMLRTAWDNARKAASSNPANKNIRKELQAMYLRDMRKRASDLADDMEHASNLLQHSSSALTQKHYRTSIVRLSPVR